MPNFLPLFIGLRYTRAKRRNGFIAFVSLFALLGMALGVFALIVVLSVMNGFDDELKRRILRVVPHAFISTTTPLHDWRELADNIAGFPSLQASAPFIEGKGMLSFGDSVRGVEIQGVLPERERGVSLVDRYMLLGELETLRPKQYGLVLGSLLARSLGVGVGDKVSLTLPVVSITPAGVFPRTKRFTVVGVFEVGAQVDESLALMHIADAQTLFRLPGQVAGLRLKFSDIYRAPADLRALLTRLGEGYRGWDWSETQGSLFQAVKMEKKVVSLMLGIIIAVAAFNIVTSLIMMVAEKRSDIAVLRTLGLSRNGVLKIFITQGVVMGVAGVVFGGLSGVATALYLPQIMAGLEQVFGFQVFDPNVYFVAYLPSVWRWQDTLWVCAIALGISLLATIYPALRAAAIAPAEALRYDS